jgi:hypothetical protein
VTQIPTEVREAVIKRLYADAERLDWEHLGVAEKSKQYANWLEDEEVGGQLLRFKPSELAVRLWMKDGPMKEYSRSVLGVGPNAPYVANPRCTPESVVEATLGSECAVVPESVEVKPARCRVRGADGEKTVIWGKSEDFKYLLFGALELLVDGSEVTCVAIVETPANPTNKADRGRMGLIAERCGIELRFINPSRPTASR